MGVDCPREGQPLASRARVTDGEKMRSRGKKENSEKERNSSDKPIKTPKNLLNTQKNYRKASAHEKY